MDNYQSYRNLGEYDDSTQMFCTCGTPVEDTQIFAEDTEYEREILMCDKCFMRELDQPLEWAIL